jgi:GntR family transcriptional regulator, transcriptional repressor for pyruvate dehydrogenase complex
MEFNAIDKKETLAVRAAQTIKEAIIRGELKPGETLPTEPELALQFNVSRAVVRDAARILMAWGLIDIRHGKGMYVTKEMNDYFLEAISTILRRKGTNSWEMQEYEQFILPEVFGMAAVNSTDKQKLEIKKQGQIYIDFIQTGNDDAVIQKKLFLNFINPIFSATNNRVLELMGQIQQYLRELRYISEDAGLEKELRTLEKKSIQMMIEAVTSGDRKYAKKLVLKIFKVDTEIQKIMCSVPLGQMVTIPADIFLRGIEIDI